MHYAKSVINCMSYIIITHTLLEGKRERHSAYNMCFCLFEPSWSPFYLWAVKQGPTDYFLKANLSNCETSAVRSILYNDIIKMLMLLLTLSGPLWGVVRNSENKVSTDFKSNKNCITYCPPYVKIQLTENGWSTISQIEMCICRKRVNKL
jgi:hypothetical protein